MRNQHTNHQLDIVFVKMSFILPPPPSYQSSHASSQDAEALAYELSPPTYTSTSTIPPTQTDPYVKSPKAESASLHPTAPESSHSTARRAATVAPSLPLPTVSRTTRAQRPFGLRKHLQIILPVLSLVACASIWMLAYFRHRACYDFSSPSTSSASAASDSSSSQNANSGKGDVDEMAQSYYCAHIILSTVLKALAWALDIVAGMALVGCLWSSFSESEPSSSSTTAIITTPPARGGADQHIGAGGTRVTERTGKGGIEGLLLQTCSVIILLATSLAVWGVHFGLFGTWSVCGSCGGLATSSQGRRTR